MGPGRSLPWLCVAAVVLGACGMSGSLNTSQSATQAPGAGLDDGAGHSDRHRGQRTPYAIDYASGISAEHRRIAREFLTFAASPNPSTAKAVPFAPRHLSLRVNSASRTLNQDEVSDAAAWFVSDGEGTTSALFVISNSMDDHRPRVAFVASPRPIPLCNLDRDPEAFNGDSVYLTLGPRGGCAEDFRVRLRISPSATVQAVDLAVRAP
jgi:hypothetical protein